MQLNQSELAGRINSNQLERDRIKYAWNKQVIYHDGAVLVVENSESVDRALNESGILNGQIANRCLPGGSESCSPSVHAINCFIMLALPIISLVLSGRSVMSLLGESWEGDKMEFCSDELGDEEEDEEENVNV